MYPYCKECCKNKSLEWSKNNHEDRLEILKRHAKTEKFKKDKRNHEKIRRENGKRKQWEDENRNKIKQYQNNRQYKKHDITNSQWIECKEYFNNCCAYCGIKIEDHKVRYNGKIINGDFHKDHVDYEGDNSLSNCIPACKNCNTSKHTSALEEWYNANNPIFKQERLSKIYKWLNEDYKLITNN